MALRPLWPIVASTTVIAIVIGVLVAGVIVVALHERLR